MERDNQVFERIAFCRNGHEVKKFTKGDIPELGADKKCKQCGSTCVEIFGDAEIEGMRPPYTFQTMLCHNLVTGCQWHEQVPVYEVNALFNTREYDRSNADIRVKEKKR